MDSDKAEPEDLTRTRPLVANLSGRYEIEALLGAGGMGDVYRARDTRLGRSVAIKSSKERFSDRFEREARATSALNHPHICTLYDVGADYLILEFVEGETLAARLKHGPLPVQEALRYSSQIAEALAEAHAHGIVHRDLKPSNIMLTRHGVKVLDFGIAKMLSETDITASRAIVGTPAYMAPEQIEGREPSGATDLYAFGLLLYEMLVGELPFPGASLGYMQRTGSQQITAPSQRRAEIPADLNDLILKLLAKDPSQRPQPAAEVARELSTIARRLAAPPRSRFRPVVIVPALAVVALLAAGAFWAFERSEQRQWAREKAIPDINRLNDERQPLAAFLLLQKVEGILPKDQQVSRLAQSLTRTVSIESAPDGAKVEIQDYLHPGGWFSLGTTPLKNVRMPKGYFRWRISKPGSADLISAPYTRQAMSFTLFPAGSQPSMVLVAETGFVEMIDFVGWIETKLPAYEIDRFEVTNAQYQEFIDQGGYRKPEYWTEKFVKDGKELTWQQAMDLFHDQTGRPGPSTWEGGHFPQGQGNFPVSGVSWYEASAYAAFSNKSLPALAQWYEAAPPDHAGYSAPQSNFSGKGPAAVGEYSGVGPYGTYDMNGNVREWCVNSIDDGKDRFILGGSWRTAQYQSYLPEALPPFDRSEQNGFRCVRNKGPLPAAISGPMVRKTRDFSKVKPASDEAFQAIRNVYAYDPTPIKASSEGIVEDTVDWTKEKITIEASPGIERFPLYLFLPKNVHPPYQTVIFFPSARVEFIRDSRTLGDMQFVDYVIKSGRALAYPIYTGTYERTKCCSRPGSVDALNELAPEAKEVSRTVDFLETRADIDKSKLAYLGVSMGTANGVIFVALEDRFKTVVFLDGGFFLTPAAPAVDQVNFAVRLKKPVLMVNGRYDFTFSPDLSQNPMFRMIGTPEADKRHVLFDTPHDISQDKAGLSREVLGWLDKYLGRVN